jgi:hypothetical protein
LFKWARWLEELMASPLDNASSCKEIITRDGVFFSQLTWHGVSFDATLTDGRQCWFHAGEGICM